MAVLVYPRRAKQKPSQFVFLIRRSVRRTVAPPHSGFTVLELLVVLGVIAMLCALVVPAVQQAREAARQIQCRNNLHQIGMALHSYSATTNCFPSGWIIETPVDHDSRNGWGWLAMLLPQMEQGPVFNSINFNHHLGNSSNETGRLRVVEAFVCPSDNVSRRVPFYFAGSMRTPTIAADRVAGTTQHRVMFEVAGASYVGVFGSEDPLDDPPDAVGSGIFFANSRARFGDVVDGLSQTIIVGERSVRWLASTWTGMHQYEEECFERVVGFAAHSPNDPDADEAEFSSRHPGGVHFLFGDGAVRFLSDHVDRGIYQALGTRGRQEAIDGIGF